MSQSKQGISLKLLILIPIILVACKPITPTNPAPTTTTPTPIPFLTQTLSATQMPTDTLIPQTSTSTSTPSRTPTITAIPLSPTPSPSSTYTNTPTPIPTASSYGAITILIPAGEFTMGGSDEFEPVIALPVHTVYLNDFAIDKFEVTNQLYHACVDAGICQHALSTSSALHPYDYSSPGYEDYPVRNVSWAQAQTYCEWRGGRLPTEAEWEKAARGTDGRTYPWGEEIDCDHANWGGYQDSNGNIGCPVSSVPSEQSTGFTLARIFNLFGFITGDTKAVGSFPRGKSPYGVFDMGGNVGEWVLDWYSLTYYQESPTENPPGPDLGSERVYRGGDYSSPSYDLVVWNRQSSPPDAQLDWIGFRCVLPTP